MFSSKELISFVFANENDTYYGDDLFKRDINQHLWKRLHENYQAVYFLSAKDDSFRVRSYGDLHCSEYTPKKKKMFGLLSGNSEQSELGGWIQKQLRAKPDSAAAFVCSLDDFCSVLSDPEWDTVLEEIAEEKKRTGIFVLTASATAEKSANLLLTSPVFEKLHETAVTDLRDGALRDLYSTLKRRKGDNCVFLNSFTWEQIYGLLLHLVTEYPDRYESCEQLEKMSDYLYTYLHSPDFACKQKLFPEETVISALMYEELYAWLKDERNWGKFEPKAIKECSPVVLPSSDIAVLRDPNSYAGRCLKIKLPQWLEKDNTAHKQAQTALDDICTEASVPKSRAENSEITAFAEKLLGQLDTVAPGDSESYNFMLSALKFCVDNVYSEKTDCIIDLLQKKQEAINIFNQHFVLQQNIVITQLSSGEATLQSTRLQQSKAQLYAIEKIKNRYIDLINAMEWDLKTSANTESLSKAWENLKAETEKYEQKQTATADDKPLADITNDEKPTIISEPEPQPEPEPEPLSKTEDDGYEYVLRDVDRVAW